MLRTLLITITVIVTAWILHHNDVFKNHIKVTNTTHQEALLLQRAHDALGQRIRLGKYPTSWIGKFQSIEQPVKLTFYNNDKTVAILEMDGQGVWQEQQFTVHPDNDINQFTIDLSLFNTPQTIATPQHHRVLFKEGIHGAMIQCRKEWRLLSTFDAVLADTPPHKMISNIAQSLGCDNNDIKTEAYNLTRYKTLSLIKQGRDGEVYEQNAGLTRFDVMDVTKDNLLATEKALANWISTHSRDDGFIEYKYWPHKGRFSDAKNMIRLWMTNQALAKASLQFNNPDMADLRRRHADHMIQNFYKPQEGYGYFLWRERAKLGANGVAALSLMEPDFIGGDIYQPSIFNNLISGIRYQRTSLGKLNPFFVPSWRQDNQAFYSGEALLALTKYIHSYPNDPLVGQFTSNTLDESFHYYQVWWHANKKTLAFVPWHTMALYYHILNTGDMDWAKAVFDMNDFLISCQETSPVDDIILGRYMRHECRRHGPPHVSSTAIYTEGLAYAYDLARQTGDVERMNAYKKAIKLGLKSMMQLVVRPENAWYYPEPDKALNGLRTSISRHEIRIDNLQHAIMAIEAVLEFGVLDNN